MNEPADRYFDTFNAYREALLEVIRYAERELILFDADLRDAGIESAAGVAALEALCQRATTADSVRILVHDVSFIERDCPRLLSLCGRFGHRLRIRVTAPSFRNYEQPFAIGDGQHLATRFHQDNPRGKQCFDCGTDCAKLVTDYESLWAVSENGPSGLPLGI